MKEKEPKKYPHIRINRTRELARRLGIPLDVLIGITKNPALHYHSWTGTRNGKSRKFYRAEHDLEAVHEKLNTEIFDRFDFPAEFQGAIQGRSLKTNAERHIRQRFVSHADIHSFFPSTSSGRVYNTLRGLGCAPDVARLITRLVTADGHLPQGFKTSPKVAALVLLPIRTRLLGLTKSLPVTFTFWLDDLTLSGSYELKNLRPSIRKIFKSAGYTVHKDAAAPTHRKQRQVVTGVVVNDKPSVKKEVRQAVEKAVFLAEKNGLRWYKRNHAPKQALSVLSRSISGRIANMMSIDERKYGPLRDRWRTVLKNAGVKP